MKTLTEFEDGTKLVFEKGKIDNYKVSFYHGTKFKKSLTDVELFKQLIQLGNTNDTWAIIQAIAKQITKQTNFHQVKIYTLNDTLLEKKLFSALAAMMIAEEHKQKSKLGKLIKLLGCYQVLIKGETPHWAANWSRKRDWRDIYQRCIDYGIIIKHKQLTLFGMHNQNQRHDDF